MMWRRLLLVLVLLQVGCSLGAVVEGEDEPTGEIPIENQPADGAVDPVGSYPAGTAAALPNLGTAPELTNEVWLNSDKPLRLGDMRGKVVLLEMWTFG